MSSPLRTTRSLSSISMWSRERELIDSSEVRCLSPWNWGESDSHSDSSKLSCNLRNFIYASKNSYVILRFSISISYFSINSYPTFSRTNSMDLSVRLCKDSTPLSGDMCTAIKNRYRSEKNDLFDIGSVYDFCLKLSILQVITSIPRTRMLDGYRRQGTSRHQG